MLDLEAIKMRRAAASPGPWHAWSVQHAWAAVAAPGNVPICDCDHRKDIRSLQENAELIALADAAFIAHAPTDIDNLIAEIERLRSALGE